MMGRDPKVGRGTRIFNGLSPKSRKPKSRNAEKCRNPESHNPENRNPEPDWAGP
jgi:hypothetical protein